METLKWGFVSPWRDTVKHHFGNKAMLSWASQRFPCGPPFGTLPLCNPIPLSALAYCPMNMPPAFSFWPHPLTAQFIFSTSSPSSSSKLNNLHRWLVPSELFKNTGQWTGVQKELPKPKAALPTEAQDNFVISSLEVHGQWAERLADLLVECLFNTIIL